MYDEIKRALRSRTKWRRLSRPDSEGLRSMERLRFGSARTLRFRVRHLEITTMIGCKVACIYCPQDKISRRYFGSNRMMKFDDFKIYVQRVPRHVVLHFTGFAEPLLNP